MGYGWAQVIEQVCDPELKPQNHPHTHTHIHGDQSETLEITQVQADRCYLGDG
jgi:hypothetical protein